ncbi:uncharacterized protein CLUP02_11901 [Colletotrichum lupini]|uniref:Uncharacterized protein n=1 Tax=Colletotrichum lupini TaxID=145971 RepID=A0A9Q8SZV8_9PEZI|nr:uncharacterized protein CLUP02_11901 [Colletotrichum lupini]UQC86400.1 hypothetical protein CLUP02_11901 [Colletotrichum lupini]
MAQPNTDQGAPYRPQDQNEAKVSAMTCKDGKVSHGKKASTDYRPDTTWNTCFVSHEVLGKETLLQLLERTRVPDSVESLAATPHDHFMSRSLLVEDTM